MQLTGLVARLVRKYYCVKLINVKMYAMKVNVLRVATPVSKLVSARLKKLRDHVMIHFGSVTTYAINYIVAATTNVRKSATQGIVALAPIQVCHLARVVQTNVLCNVLILWKLVLVHVERNMMAVNTTVQRNVTKGHAHRVKS